MQLELPFDATPYGEDRGTALDRTLDALQDRYGAGSVTRGVLLGRSSGLEMPQLPDPGPAGSGSATG